jgi:3-dehydroquinate synthase II
LKDYLRRKGIWFTENTDLKQVAPQIDVCYQTRTQTEVGSAIDRNDRSQGYFIVDREIADSAYRYQQEIDSKKRIIVGINDYVADKPITIPILEMDKEGEKLAVELAKKGLVIVTTTDWTIIPLENLVAQSDHFIAVVRTAKEAEVTLSILEKGVHGVLLRTDDPSEIRQTALLIKEAAEHIELIPFTVTSIKPVGMGDRVCIDTCSILAEGQGVLVGDTSSGFLLMHAETLVNPYVSPRPFRVNAGAAHAYTLTPAGKTAYLSELGSGDKVLVVDESGNAVEAIIGG